MWSRAKKRIQETISNMQIQLAGAPYRFFITPEVHAKFNEYARAATVHCNSEIGGMARVKRYGNDWLVVDIKIFPQQATVAHFELDPVALAKFMQELHKTGRGDEIEEWCSLIHSHPPGTPPFLSGPDRRNIEFLAQQRFAWSIIATAHEDVDKMDTSKYAVHFFAGGEVPIIAENMPVRLYHPDRQSIESEVKELITSGWNSRSAPTKKKWQDQNPSNKKAKKTSKTQKVKAYHFDLESTDIREGDLVRVVLNENSIKGAEPEAVELMSAMNGEVFIVGGIDPHGFLVEDLVFTPNELELVEKADAIEFEDEAEVDVNQWLLENDLNDEGVEGEAV